MSVNRAILVGNLGKDPELKYTQSGKAVCSFSLATSESWKDKQGVKTDSTTWHNIVAWGKQAEVMAEHLTKGKQIYLEGRISNRNYDKDGEKKYISEVVVQSFQFIGAKSESTAKTTPDDSSELPF